MTEQHLAWLEKIPTMGEIMEDIDCRFLLKCWGHTPEQIDKIIEQAKVGEVDWDSI